MYSILLTEAAGPVHVTTTGKLLVGQWRLDGDATGFPFRTDLLSVLDADLATHVCQLNHDASPRRSLISANPRTAGRWRCRSPIRRVTRSRCGDQYLMPDRQTVTCPLMRTCPTSDLPSGT
jgi:hypothetical protein